MDPNIPPAASQAGFLREGFRELGRKLDRRRLRNQSRQLDRERAEAAMRVGEQAWREKVDLPELAALRAQLEELEARAGALTATQTKLQGEKTGLEARRRDETAKYDALHKEVEARKRPVDEALATARRRLNEQARGVARLQARLASLASELSALEKLPDSAAAQDARQLADRESRIRQLAAEQKSASEKLATANVNVPALSAEITRLEGESRQLAAEIQKVESDRTAALAPLQAELKRVAGEAGAARKEAGLVAEGRRAALTQLGLALYELKSPEPALAAGMAEMVAIDRRRASTRSALDASLLLTRSMPRGTMLKFWGAFVLVPMLLAGLAAGTFLARTLWHHRPQADLQTISAPEESNPLLNHPLATNPAYVLADKLAAAKSEQEVADLMLEAFKTIHLGVYTAEGGQILAGSERSDKDFYLYDFEVRILAHAYFERNVIDFNHESAALGAALLKLDHPKSFAPLLKYALVKNYDRARQEPNDPSSFLILLVDGLARHEVNPYSLDEVTRRPGKELYLDPLQAFLITLDAFVPSPGNSDVSWRGTLRLPWEEFGTVHAAGSCSGVKGNGQGGNWGRTASIMGLWATAVSQGTKIAAATELLGDKATAVASHVSSITGRASNLLSIFKFIHDMLWLYAVTIRIKPPDKLHWNHQADNANEASFVATVTYELKKPPQGPIRCGAAAGLSLPQSPQRLKGVDLMWHVEPQDCLQLKEQTTGQAKYMTGESSSNIPGSLSGSLGWQTTTEPDGTSQLNMDVSCQCPQPPWGKVVSRSYRVMASERHISAQAPSPAFQALFIVLNRLPGGIEYVMGGKTGYAHFPIYHHLPLHKGPGVWKIDIHATVKEHASGTDNDTGDVRSGQESSSATAHVTEWAESVEPLNFDSEAGPDWQVRGGSWQGQFSSSSEIDDQERDCRIAHHITTHGSDVRQFGPDSQPLDIESVQPLQVLFEVDAQGIEERWTQVSGCSRVMRRGSGVHHVMQTGHPIHLQNAPDWTGKCKIGGDAKRGYRIDCNMQHSWQGLMGLSIRHGTTQINGQLSVTITPMTGK